MCADLGCGVDSTESVSRHASEETDVGVHDVSEDHLPSEPLSAASHSTAEVTGIPQITEADEVCASEALIISSPDFVDAANTEQYLPPEPEEEPNVEQETTPFVQMEDGNIVTTMELAGSDTELVENETLKNLQEDVSEVKFKIGEFEEPVMEDKEEHLPSADAAGKQACLGYLLLFTHHNAMIF